MSRVLSEYGMLLVLLLLCAVFSALTYREQHPSGAAAAPAVAREVVSRFGPGARVLIAGSRLPDDDAFAASLEAELRRAGATIAGVVRGEPRDARQALVALADSGQPLHAIACQKTTAGWLVFSDLKSDFRALGDVPVVTPRSYRWPNFLKSENLLNIANQIAVIAIVAIGMTMVIIAGGIDLSVGSLIALAAVDAALVIREAFGGPAAGPLGMIAGGLAGIFACAAFGGLSGVMVTAFKVPPFIVTLGTMLVASGVAYRHSSGQSVYQLPESFVWLGRGADLLNIPNAVVLMLVLYLAAHVLMTRTTLGRYLYAVGGNAEAARLSGVPVTAVLLFAYVASASLAGLGGVVMASQLKSGSPTYGVMYELYVIAAVVVGGTSLSGGEGRIGGTLIGAFIIAVIQNGMNLMGIESYTQKIVLGIVILAAVLLDRLKRRGISWRWKLTSGTRAA